MLHHLSLRSLLNQKVIATKKEKSKRINITVFRPLERRILPPMADYLPSWVKPDHLTGVAMIGALLTGFSYWFCHWGRGFLWLANLGLLIHWWGDSLDGTLARVRRIEREKYGFFVDHLCDALSVLIICAGLGASPYMHLNIALLLAISYFLLMILVYLLTYVRGIFKISFGGAGPTESRAIMFILNSILYLFHNPLLEFRWLDLYFMDILGGIATLILLFVFLVDTCKNLIYLDKIDHPGTK